ncbi:hypothetical protein [Paenibacillus sp. PK1-4R]|uniref:hypothetical protein n=1 Tax=Paenibacillus sp. PK1-4R TaxID=3049075 RepID=UPI0025A05817|nr:hypothetical protein [Paenibacillus sp. PK1-4R]WJM09521.1 hypothetical protein QNO02_06175 [Paenibacillus sp. PK1-4R]
MPTLDFFSLGNYRLGGPPGGGKYSLLNPGPNASTGVTLGQNNRNYLAYTYATFEAGAKLITGTARNTGTVSYISLPATIDSVYAFFALYDGVNYWPIHGSSAAGQGLKVLNLLYFVIDLQLKISTCQYRADNSSYTSTNTINWNFSQNTAPANFDVTAPLKLVLWSDNTSTSSVTATHYFNTTLVSL